MRVQYTLPGLEPAISPQAQAQEAAAPSFKNKLRRISSRMPQSWQRLLRLDQAPPDATMIGPPPAPPALDRTDSDALRLRWRALTGRRPAAAPDAASADAVAKMHVLLR